MTRPGRRSGPSPSPVPAISVSPVPAGRYPAAPIPDPPPGGPGDLQGASAPTAQQDGDHRPADPDLEMVQRSRSTKRRSSGCWAPTRRPRPARSTGCWSASTSAARFRSSRIRPGLVRSKRPARQRATYKKNKGVRKLLGAYDVGADRLWGRSRPAR